MKKSLLMILLVLLISSSSYGAVSQDVYVRQDVFDAKMEALFERLHGEIVTLKSELKTEISALRSEFKEEISALRSEFKEEISALGSEVTAKMGELSGKLGGEISSLKSEIRGVDRRMDDLRQDIYLGLVILGLLAGFPAAKEFFKWREERKEASKQVITLEDVKRLIAEAQLSGKSQL